MSNLPPGVTHADIDRRFGGAEDTWPLVLECDHIARLDQAYDYLQQLGFFDEQVERHGLYRTLDKLLPTAPSVFDDNEVLDLTASWSGAHGTATWTCPVCFEVHETEADAADLVDD